MEDRNNQDASVIEKQNVSVVLRLINYMVNCLGLFILFFIVAFFFGAWFGFFWQPVELGWNAGKTFFHWLFELPWGKP